MNQGPEDFSPPPAVWPPPPTNFVSQPAEASPLAGLEIFRVQSVWLVLFLTLLTGGIYAVFWLRQQNKTLNLVRPDLKVTLLYGNIVLTAAFVNVGLVIASCISSVQPLNLVGSVFEKLFSVMLLILLFQVRNGLNIMLEARRGDSYWFSGLWTWLLGVLYLQYKLNKNIRQWQNESGQPFAQ